MSEKQKSSNQRYILIVGLAIILMTLLLTDNSDYVDLDSANQIEHCVNLGIIDLKKCKKTKLENKKETLAEKPKDEKKDK